MAALRVAAGSHLAKGRPSPRSVQPPLLATAPCMRDVRSLLRVGRWRSSLSGVPLATAPVGWLQPTAPVGGCPLRVVAPTGSCPLQVAGSPLVGGHWLQPVAPAGGLGRSRLPLAASHGQPLVLAILTANALNDSTRFNLITRNLKSIIRTKTWL
ncbi:hypothetical protein GW17_00055233 [Ensete ventricosum]|nr:hypothetical protein GW17_00055233 [Ensete ventricosum]